MAKELSKFAHPEYIYHLPDYQKIRDCFQGERAVKDGGDLYLPRLTNQLEHDYQNYKRRALFFPITGKTVTTMVGLATTKPPKTTYPDLMASYFHDTEQDYQFTEFYVGVFTEVTLMGRYGVLIDAPVDGASLPSLVPYLAENIVRWEMDSTGKPVDLLLKEHLQVPDTTERFKINQVCQYRHCFIQNGVYCQEVLDEDLKSEGVVFMPTFSGSTIDYIPFVPFGASGVHYSVDRPPMLDIATINISHYMSSADLEWGRHITGLPTPVITGVDASSKMAIGGTTAWVLPDPQSKAFYLEFLGQGLASLENAMKEKVGLMASVSARLVDSSTRGSEAAETVRLRYMSESASLVHIINSIESGMLMLYNMLAKLVKSNGQVTIQFSREIIGLGITFKDLKILFDAYLEGSVSKETLLFNLRRLEAVDPNRSDADELAAIRNPPPMVDPNKPPAATPPAPKPAN